jgi:hypothetical protein
MQPGPHTMRDIRVEIRDVTMQTLPQTDRKHLSHDAALMLLAVGARNGAS